MGSEGRNLVNEPVNKIKHSCSLKVKYVQDKHHIHDTHISTQIPSLEILMENRACEVVSHTEEPYIHFVIRL